MAGHRRQDTGAGGGGKSGREGRFDQIVQLVASISIHEDHKSTVHASNRPTAQLACWTIQLSPRHTPSTVSPSKDLRVGDSTVKPIFSSKFLIFELELNEDFVMSR